MSDDYEAIRDALDDLASAVNDRYAGYPATDRRYVRDLAVVTQASAALQRLESRPAPEQSRETRDAAVQKRLDEYVRLRDGTGGCTDGGCVIKRPTGMHTNGGCKCSHDKYKAMRMMYAGQQLADALLAAMDRSALGREE